MTKDLSIQELADADQFLYEEFGIIDNDKLSKWAALGQKERQRLQEIECVVKSWIEKYNPACEESFYQMDRVNEALPELGEALFKLISKG